MKIGFDAKRAFLNRTGLGNYSRWLINGLAKHHPENSYFLYTTKVNDGVYSPKKADNVHVKTPALKLFTSRWRTSGIVKDIERDGIELYHGLSHELPIGIRRSGAKCVVTVHDLIFMRFPQYFSWVNRWIYRNKLIVACRAADRIVAISQKTKADIIELLDADPAKIDVIYQGCDPAFKSPQTGVQKQAVKSKYQLPDRYLLSVGTIEPRKNLLTLVKALQHIADIKLVVVGKPTAYLEEVKAYISRNQLESRIILLHKVTFAELPAIYQMAHCFIYPSRYEGFGIPILEALSSGVPVVAATSSCLEEAGGPDSLYASPDDETEIAAKINEILADETLRQNMIAQGLLYSSNFDDEKLIAQYANLYKNVLKHA